VHKKSTRDPSKIVQDFSGDRDPQVENHTASHLQLFTCKHCLQIS